jgi:S1-C subfamily serine protease
MRATSGTGMIGARREHRPVDAGAAILLQERSMATAATPYRKAWHRLSAIGALRHLGLAALFAMLAAAPAHGQQKRVDEILAAVVGIHADVPVSARTADTLGTARTGSGVVIDDQGLVLTIGYLIMEAGITDVVDAGGRTIPADIVAYDYESGFGLLRTLQPLTVGPLEFGESASLKPADQVLVVSRASGEVAATPALVAGRREFAGYWEYLLADAIFTAPVHESFGGAALIDRQGRLLGIGSLMVGDAAGEGTGLPGNMFVPIDALKPILDELLAEGRRRQPSHPWLGLSAQERSDGIHVASVARDGPAQRAGLREGDLIVGIAGQPAAGLADFYRRVWALGPAGVDVPLSVQHRSGSLEEVRVQSADRYDWLRLNPTY